MFEEDHPQSPTEQAQPKKRMGTAVMLAAGGVVVATLFATVASMLAASGREATPERTSADVVQTITSVAPDGSTSTVVVTASSGAPKPGTPDQPQLTTDPTQPTQTQTQTQSTAPSETEVPSSTTPSSESPTAPPSSSSSSTGVPDPKP